MGSILCNKRNFFGNQSLKCSENWEVRWWEFIKKLIYMKVQKSLASHTAISMRSSDNYSVVHLLQRSTFHGVKLCKKFWKCSQRRLEGENLEGGVLFYKSKVLVSCTQMCHDPVGHTGNHMLSPIPIALQNIQKMGDWVQTFGAAVCQMAKAGTLQSYLDQREIQLGEPVSFKLSHFEEQLKKKGGEEV